MKHWEIIADNLSKAGWSWGCVATVDANGRTIFAVEAHRGVLARSWYRALSDGTGEQGGKVAARARKDEKMPDKMTIAQLLVNEK